MSSVMLEERVGTYSVKPVKKTWLPDTSDGHILFSGVKKIMVPQFSLKNRQYVTGLTVEEASGLEKELSLKEGTLAPSNKEFWGSYLIPVSKEGEILDISKPQDYLKYKILKASTLVATSHEDMQGEKGLMAELLMVSDAKEAATESKKLQIKLDAFAAFNKMSISDYVDFLSVYAPRKLKVTDKHNPDFLRAEVGKIVDSKPQDFLTAINDKYYKGKIMIEKAITLGAITKDGTKYLVTGDIEPFAHGLVDAIEYLHDPKNQATRINIEAKLNAA